MSKWRPSVHDCIYVIPDIHGASNMLEKILARILPLRKIDGIKDKIIFLGDYIDRGKDGHKIIDSLINIKNEYKEQAIFLLGNHEMLLFKALGWVAKSDKEVSPYDLWLMNGGYNTILGYIERTNSNVNPLSLAPNRINSLIPNEHKTFLLECLEVYHKIDNFVFLHGGCDPDDILNMDESLLFSEANKISSDQLNTIVWDRSLCKYVINAISNNNKLEWDNVIVTGHNAHQGRGKPIITDKFMMLDCGSPKQLLVVELNSMEAFMAYPDKDRLIKFNLKEAGTT